MVEAVEYDAHETLRALQRALRRIALLLLEIRDQRWDYGRGFRKEQHMSCALSLLRETAIPTRKGRTDLIGTSGA